MAALAVQIAARRSIFVDGRDANVASMDYSADRLLEWVANDEVGERAGAAVGPDPDEAGLEGDGGASTIGRGAPGDV